MIPDHFVTADNIASQLAAVSATAGAVGAEFRSRVIGYSREGRPLHMFTIGSGANVGSIVAGAHADEPCGPRATFAIAARFLAEPDWQRVRDDWTLHIVPQCNPDGAERNRSWFADEVALDDYLRLVAREAPGEDIEFGYPNWDELRDANSAESYRPENVAIASALADVGTLMFHASLHGMGFSEGAWWLLSRDWAARSEPLRESLRALAQDRMMPLHDIERHGEKGFSRIAPGFCTTPRSDAMREFFLAKNDAATAKQFRPSSMEIAASLGEDVLCMVTEMPIFRVHQTRAPWPTYDAPAPPSPTPYEELRERLPAVRAALVEGDSEPADTLTLDFGITSVPARLHVDLIAESVRIALEFRAGTRAVN